MRYFSSIIKEENLRMNRQVETILKASQFDKGEVQLNLKPIAVHAALEKVVDNFKLQLEHTGGHINLFLRAKGTGNVHEGGGKGIVHGRRRIRTHINLNVWLPVKYLNPNRVPAGNHTMRHTIANGGAGGVITIQREIVVVG